MFRDVARSALIALVSCAITVLVTLAATSASPAFATPYSEARIIHAIV
jgi:hypothetical protein